MRNFKLIKGFSKKIKTFSVEWTPEMVQDIEAYHDIDVEQELLDILSQEFAREIDREIFNTIVFPAARRVFAQTLANDLVAVQPLDAPLGTLHYLDYIYDNYKFKNFKLLKG